MRASHCISTVAMPDAVDSVHDAHVTLCLWQPRTRQLHEALSDIELAMEDWARGQARVIDWVRYVLTHRSENEAVQYRPNHTADVSLNKLFRRLTARLRTAAEVVDLAVLPACDCPAWVVGTFPLYAWGDEVEGYLETLLRTLALSDPSALEIDGLVAETNTRSESIGQRFEEMKRMVLSAISQIECEWTGASDRNDSGYE